MTRALRSVSGADVLPALRLALSGDGPAILPGVAGETGLTRVEVGVAAVIETSGSTGHPKRVVLSRHALLASAAASASALGGPGQWLLALPTTYVAGLNVLVRSIASGVDPIVVASGAFTAEKFRDATRRMSEPVRFVSLVPAQLARILDDSDATAAARRFDRVLVGGQSLPSAVRERALAAGIRMTTTYGSSETCGGCVYDGVPIGTTAATIVDGEVQLAGPMLADGYLHDPARTEAVFVLRDGQRWYRTGDSGEMVDGVLRVTGRFDDVIISGGEKVSLGAIERLLHGIPELSDAVVVASQSDRWGEVPVVFTTRHVDAATLRALVADRLGRAAVPDRVIVVDSLPTLDSGKPDRAQLATDAHR